MMIPIPRNNRKIAAAMRMRARARIGMKKGCSWFLKELKRITGPAKDRGNDPAKVFIPCINLVLLVCLLSCIMQIYCFTGRIY